MQKLKSLYPCVVFLFKTMNKFPLYNGLKDSFEAQNTILPEHASCRAGTRVAIKASFSQLDLTQAFGFFQAKITTGFSLHLRILCFSEKMLAYPKIKAQFWLFYMAEIFIMHFRHLQIQQDSNARGRNIFPIKILWRKES